MNKFKLLLCTVACLSVLTLNAQRHGYSATVTDASRNFCNDGAIDLHPPAGASGFNYTWYKIGQAAGPATPISSSEDLNNIPPGQYIVKIDGPLCFDFDLIYFVGVTDYDFEIKYINPGNCHEGKLVPQNGLIFVSWNPDITPQPVVIHENSNTQLVNEQPLPNLNPGTHRLSFSIGSSCSWVYDIHLCCCSLEEGLLPEEFGGVCDNLLDDEPFSFEIISVDGASGPNEADGNINMRLTSPGPNKSIKWTGPLGSPSSRSFYSTSLRGVLPGVYQYQYEDDCYNKQGTIEVDDCSSSNIAPILAELEVVGTCPGTNEGSITLDVGLRERDFRLYVVDLAGDQGQEISNYIVLETNPDYTRIKFDEL